MRYFWLLLLILPTTSFAQSQNAADIFGTKAYLENLMIERFSRELSTRVDESKFEISANIEVSRVKKKPSLLLDDSFTDIDLGFLDPDRLLSQRNESQISSFLRNFEVRKINVMAGIHEELGPEVKADVETWLTKRVKDEFGSRGSSEVLFIKKPTVEKVPDKVQSPLELLRDFQELASMVVLVLAVFMGILLWKILSGKASEGPSIKVNNNLEKGKGTDNSGADAGGGIAGNAVVQSETKEKETLQKQINNIAEDIKELTPKLGAELEKVIEEWCRLGEEGYTRVACFAEIVGQSMGRVPIPPEFHENVTSVFTRMHEMNLNSKLSIVNQVYWDMMAVLNLGPAYLHRPFSFLKDANTVSIGQALLDNDSEVQAVASMYMTREAREHYLSAMDQDKKKQLLEVAAGLEKIEYDAFEKMESDLAPMFESDEEVKTVSLTRALESIIEAIPHRESIFMLNELSGPVIETYKRTQPSLAFVHQWPDLELNNLIQQVGQQELMALLVLREDLYNRVVELVPPRLKTIIKDDYKSAQKMSDMEIEQLLEKLHMNLVLFVDKGLVDLQSVFTEEIKAASGDNEDSGGEETPAA